LCGVFDMAEWQGGSILVLLRDTTLFSSESCSCFMAEQCR
jgi:hypothetical protein